MKIALFDFDGTLYPHETFNVLIERLKNHPEYKKNYKRFILRFAPSYFGYKLKLVPKLKMQNKAVESYMLSFKGHKRTEIEAFFQEVADDMADDLRESLLETIRDLKERQYYVMLVSGAFMPLLNALFKESLFDEIIGTEVHYNGEIYDHKSNVERVHSGRKIVVIKDHFKDQAVDWLNSHAYSDSYSDIQMLELVGHPFAVAPDEELKAAAAKNNWKIILDHN